MAKGRKVSDYNARSVRSVPLSSRFVQFVTEGRLDVAGVNHLRFGTCLSCDEFLQIADCVLGARWKFERERDQNRAAS